MDLFVYETPRGEAGSEYKPTLILSENNNASRPLIRFGVFDHSVNLDISFHKQLKHFSKDTVRETFFLILKCENLPLFCPL